MKGKNEIHINQLTMQEAIQLWLADQFKSPPKVTQVKKDHNSNQSTDFIVMVEQKEPGTKAG